MDNFWDRLEAYVRAYLPQWQYEKNGGETQAALMTALGALLEDTIGRFARLPEKHELEFLRGFDPQRQEAVPMHVYGALTAPRGQLVACGSEFYLSGDGTRLWKTEEDAWAGPGRLAQQVFSGGESGKLIVLPPPAPGVPTPLFDFRPQGTQRREARFSHPDAFASCHGCRVWLALPGAEESLRTFLCDGEAVGWSLECEGRSVPLAVPASDGPALCFDLPPAPDARALVAQVADGHVPPEGAVGTVLARTQRQGLACDAVIADDGVCLGEGWLPFGESPEPWKSCCIACPDALSLRGANLTVSWTQSFRRREELLPGMEQEPEYKPIMRRLPTPPPEIRDVYAAGVVWEYWNGAAWQPVPGTQQYFNLFAPAGEKNLRVEARFSWPADAGACEVQGMSACWLRWRVRSAEGCGWLPRRSHAPEITGLRFSAVLEGARVSVEHKCGLTDLFSPIAEERQALFFPLTAGSDAWWLSFDQPPGEDTLNLYLSLRGRTPGGRLTAWEAVSDGGGERALVLTDGTDGLSHSGMLLLAGIKGKTCFRFGTLGWWLCLRDEMGVMNRSGRRPVLEALFCGAVRMRSASGDRCLAGESLLPLRGGAVSGRTLSESFGGVPEETDREVLRRTRNQRHYQGRAVSALDVEQIVCDTIRDAVRTRCIRNGDILDVCVLMRDVERHTDAFSLKKEEIRRLLERKSAMPALGLDIQVVEPRFCLINVMVWVRPEEGAEFAEIKRAIEKVLARFLHPVTGNFHGYGWRIGRLPTPLQLRNRLQSAVPDGAVKKLIYTVTTPEGRELDYADIRDPFALPLGGEYVIREIRGEGPA